MIRPSSWSPPLPSSQCGLNGAHMSSWVCLSWPSVSSVFLADFKSSLRSKIFPDNASSFCFLSLHFTHIYLFIHSVFAQSLLSTKHYGKDILMIKIFLPEPGVEFLGYYLCCTYQWRVLELEVTLESEIYFDHRITQMSTSFYQYLMHLICLLFIWVCIVSIKTSSGSG